MKLAPWVTWAQRVRHECRAVDHGRRRKSSDHMTETKCVEREARKRSSKERGSLSRNVPPCPEGAAAEKRDYKSKGERREWKYRKRKEGLSVFTSQTAGPW